MSMTILAWVGASGGLLAGIGAMGIWLWPRQPKERTNPANAPSLSPLSFDESRLLSDMAESEPPVLKVHRDPGYMEYLSIGDKKFAPWPSDGTETDQNRIDRTCWLEAKDDLYRKGYIKPLTRASFILTDKGSDLADCLYWDTSTSQWLVA